LTLSQIDRLHYIRFATEPQSEDYESLCGKIFQPQSTQVNAMEAKTETKPHFHLISENKTTSVAPMTPKNI